MRSSRRESLAEVSGAVEIDVDLLANFEQGRERPTEDILLLLMSHFSLKEEEATKLWELAGYDQKKPSPSGTGSERDISQAVVIMPTDARIVYTDRVHIMVNDYGVVINFMQTSGVGSHPLAVARVGMSREHAHSVLELLKKSLKSDVKALPTPDESSSGQSSDKA